MDNIVEHLRKLGRGEVELVDWEFRVNILTILISS